MTPATPRPGPDARPNGVPGDGAPAAGWQLTSAAQSDRGQVRHDNQDSGYANHQLLVIADGVGGAARGDVASSVAVDTLQQHLNLPAPAEDEPLARIAHAIHLTHERLGELVEQHPELEGTSTTTTVALFDGHTLHIGHVGDSRAYLLRDGVLTGLTTDHTLVQSLVDEGQITAEEALTHPHRNLILKAVDGVHEPDPDLFSTPLQLGDRLLLCSDGCSGVLSQEQITQLLAGPDLDQLPSQFIRASLDADSADNISVVVAEVTPASGALAADAEARAAAATLIGAAVGAPQLQLADLATGNISEAELAELAATDPGPDPEELRYAPQAPPRWRWVRTLLVVAVALGLIAGGLFAFRQWTQKQYFVGAHEGTVVIYRGITVEIPWVSPREIAATTTIQIDRLEEVDARTVDDGIIVPSVAEGLRKASTLRFACEELADPGTDTSDAPADSDPATGPKKPGRKKGSQRPADRRSAPQKSAPQKDPIQRQPARSTDTALGGKTPDDSTPATDPSAGTALDPCRPQP